MLPFSRKYEDGLEDSRLLEEYNKETIDQATHSPDRLEIQIHQSFRTSGYVRRFLFFLLPTFIQYRLRPTGKPTKLHPTAFLDGMRGLAALFVFFYHLASCSYDVLSAYGASASGPHREWLKLPFIRFIYSGPAMVSVFFVVSGYALSYKPVKLMRSGNWTELLHTQSSSTFRRAIRLYLPCVISTLLIIFLVRLGAYDWGRGFAESNHHFLEHHVARIKRTETLHAQLVLWAKEMWKFFHPWSFGTKDTDINVDGHLWTIAVEFRSSLVLYLTQTGIARLKPTIRILVLVALIFWCLFKDRWEMILFYAGFLLAELDIKRRATAPSTATSATTSRMWNTTYIVVFLAGIYLGAQPQRGVEKSPGWVTLYAWIPDWVHYKQRYWAGWAAIMLVWSTSNSGVLQRLFINAAVQYLGKISFSLYLMHGPVTHSLGFAAMNFLYVVIGTETAMKKATAWVFSAIATTVVTVWAADVFTRTVDTPTVRFARWLEGKCSVS